MVDSVKLRNKIRGTGKSAADFAQGVGMSAPTLWRKVTGKSEFTVNEVTRVSDALGLTRGERESIFFGSGVANMEHGGG